MKSFKNQGRSAWAGLARMTSLSLAIPLCIVMSGCIGEAPVRVERNCSQDPYVPTFTRCSFKITSLVDSIVIKGVSGNRGQCTVNPYEKLPFTGKFGKILTVSFSCSDIIEVGIKTDQGDWDFSFK